MIIAESSECCVSANLFSIGIRTIKIVFAVADDVVDLCKVGVVWRLVYVQTDKVFAGWKIERAGVDIFLGILGIALVCSRAEEVYILRILVPIAVFGIDVVIIAFLTKLWSL